MKTWKIVASIVGVFAVLSVIGGVINATATPPTPTATPTADGLQHAQYQRAHRLGPRPR
jgi:hypothetical protein